MSKLIPLQGKHGGGRFAIVDDEHYEVLGSAYWICNNLGYVETLSRVEGKHILLHRVVTGAVHGQVVDHIDGNRLNNQRDNLRLCDESINALNQNNKRKAGVYSSEYRGVHWEPKRRKWRARIKLGGSRKCLGRYDSESDASRAYSRAVGKYLEKRGAA